MGYGLPDCDYPGCKARSDYDHDNKDHLDTDDGWPAHFCNEHNRLVRFLLGIVKNNLLSDSGRKEGA